MHHFLILCEGALLGSCVVYHVFIHFYAFLSYSSIHTRDIEDFFTTQIQKGAHPTIISPIHYGGLSSDQLLVYQCNSKERFDVGTLLILQML